MGNALPCSNSSPLSVPAFGSAAVGNSWGAAVGCADMAEAMDEDSVAMEVESADEYLARLIQKHTDFLKVWSLVHTRKSCMLHLSS